MDGKANDKEDNNNNNTTYVWRCTVCGTIYDSDPLPEHYICKTCGAPAPKYERIKRSEVKDTPAK